MVTIIGIAILFGIFFSFDLFFCEKRNGTFTRQLISVITVSIPAIYNAIFNVAWEKDSFSYLWFHYFYTTLVVVCFIFAGITYYCVYRSIIRLIKGTDSERLYTFFDFAYKGYNKFKESVQQAYKAEKSSKLSLTDASISAINNDLRTDMIEFINQIYGSVDEAEIDGYIGYVLFGFVDNFLAECNARFTLRELDPKTNKMKAIITTKENASPGDIDISKPNLISKSMELGRPVFYSDFRDHHFRTSKNSVGNGKYEDYVSYCLLCTSDNKPFYSICLDVKGETGRQKMKALVDSLIFEVICNAIALKIMKRISEGQETEEK